MDAATYKLIHFIGIFLLVAGIGGYLFAKEEISKLAGVSHGIGWILVFLGGFGMQKHDSIGFTWWFIVKVVILVILGGIIVIAKRKLLPPFVTWLIVMALVGFAAWLGFNYSVILRPV